MTTKRLPLSSSPTGVRKFCEIDSDGRELIAVEHTPTSVEQQIVDHCSALRHGRRGSQNMRHVATVPILTYMMWQKEYRTGGYANTVTWKEFVAAKLNSGEFSKLRVDEGRV